MGELIPIVGILATAWVIVTAMKGSRAKGALPASEDRGLARENDRLHGTVERLEARIAVLEQIATDPAERTAREIERLR